MYFEIKKALNWLWKDLTRLGEMDARGSGCEHRHYIEAKKHFREAMRLLEKSELNPRVKEKQEKK
jgi:hypothetical protein